MAYRPVSTELIGEHPFALHCRGDVRLYLSGSDCTPRSKKARALLAVLAAERRPLTRTKIVDLLWSDREDQQARASLRTLLADMREQFGNRFEQLLLVDRERVMLAPGVRIDFTNGAAGDLFEGLDHLDPQLDDWLRVERARLPLGAPADPSSGPLDQSAGVRLGPTELGLLAAALIALAALALL